MNRTIKMTKTIRILLCLSLGYVSVEGLAFADTINLGFISFDGFIPGNSGSPGVNEFSINNFTGDPNLGGFALPPDFPVLDFLTFQNSQLTVVESSGNETFPLGDLAAGTTISDLSTASVDILSATFSATLDQTTFSLSDGSMFTAGSAAIRASVTPGSPPFLNTGDFALITVSNAPAAIPEPASWWLLLVAALPVVYRRTRMRL